MEARLFAQAVEHRELVRGEIDALGDERVFAAGLVLRGDRQGVEDLADPGGRDALDDKRVKRVVGADRRKLHRAALRGLRVDILEILEAGRVFQLTEERQAVAPGRRHGCDGGERQDEAEDDTKWPAHHASRQAGFKRLTTGAPVGARAGLRRRGPFRPRRATRASRANRWRPRRRLRRSAASR